MADCSMVKYARPVESSVGGPLSAEFHRVKDGGKVKGVSQKPFDIHLEFIYVLFHQIS